MSDVEDTMVDRIITLRMRLDDAEARLAAVAKLCDHLMYHTQYVPMQAIRAALSVSKGHGDTGDVS